MRNQSLAIIVAGVTSILFYSCSPEEKRDPLFEKIPPEQSGIYFQNNLEETQDFNSLNYLYFYNGGGVSIGDFNGDGLEDIYFTANQDSNHLYLNKGNFVFNKVTDDSGCKWNRRDLDHWLHCG